jgi:hypothetical protein
MSQHPVRLRSSTLRLIVANRCHASLVLGEACIAKDQEVDLLRHGDQTSSAILAATPHEMILSLLSLSTVMPQISLYP